MHINWHWKGIFRVIQSFEKKGKDVIPRYYYQSNIHRNEAAAKDYFEDFSTYLISGSIYATSSWHETEFYAAPVADSADHYRWTAKITFGRRGNSRPFQESGWGMGTAPLVTWTVANKAKLSILFSDIDSPVTMKVKLKPFLVPGKLDEQRVNVFFGNTLVGTWSLTVNRFQTVELTIPQEMFNLAGKTVISFELPDAKSPQSLGAKAGKSSLALAFFSMEFEKESTANEQ